MNSAIRTVQLRDTCTAYSVQGSEGPPIVLIHGAEATRVSFERIGALLGRKLTVYSYDQRQCGETRSEADATSILDLVDDAAQFIEALALEGATVLGTSFGGRIAQGLAIRYPRLVGRLVLCNTWPLDVALEAANPQGMARLHALRLGLPDTARELAEAYYGPAHVGLHPELVARFAQQSGGGSGVGPRTALARSTQPLAARQIAVPTLLVCASQDEVVPPRVTREMHDQVAGSQLVEIEGTHHAITVERPAEVAGAIEAFLQREGVIR